MSETDLEKLASMTEAAALQNALDDPDTPPLESMKSPVAIRMRDAEGRR